MDAKEVLSRLRDYPFYHTIKLTEDMSTPGWPVVIPIVNLTLQALEGLDFKDKRVLDVGCRDGLFAFEAERRGAREILAIDNDVSRGAVELLIPFLHSRVRMVEMNFCQLDPAAF